MGFRRGIEKRPALSELSGELLCSARASSVGLADEFEQSYGRIDEVEYLGSGSRPREESSTGRRCGRARRV